MAYHDHRATHRLHARVHEAYGRGARAYHSTYHVGNWQKLARRAEGVRSHGRLHQGDDRNVKATRQFELSLHGCRWNDWPDPPTPLGVVLCMGPYNYPL